MSQKKVARALMSSILIERLLYPVAYKAFQVTSSLGGSRGMPDLRRHRNQDSGVCAVTSAPFLKSLALSSVFALRPGLNIVPLLDSITKMNDEPFTMYTPHANGVPVRT